MSMEENTATNRKRPEPVWTNALNAPGGGSTWSCMAWHYGTSQPNTQCGDLYVIEDADGLHSNPPTEVRYYIVRRHLDEEVIQERDRLYPGCSEVEVLGDAFDSEADAKVCCEELHKVMQEKIEGLDNVQQSKLEDLLKSEAIVESLEYDSGGGCCHTFYLTKEGYIYSLHFRFMEVEKSAERWHSCDDYIKAGSEGERGFGFEHVAPDYEDRYWSLCS